MKNRSQYWLWTALIGAIILGMIWQFAPIPDAQERVKELPLNGIGFQGKAIPLEPFEEEYFKDVTVLKRVYEVDGQYFFVTILDGTKNRHVVHDPYYCFRGGGWEIIEEHTFSLNKGNGSKLLITKDNQQREALFWFSDGSKQHSSPLNYWLQTSLRRLTLGMSGNEPLLIVVQPLMNEPVNWEAFKKHFSNLFEI